MACRDYLPPENVDAANEKRFLAESCECCKDGWPRIKRYDGKFFHSLPEPCPDILCGVLDAIRSNPPTGI